MSLQGLEGGQVRAHTVGASAPSLLLLRIPPNSDLPGPQPWLGGVFVQPDTARPQAGKELGAGG